jgi:hypothetical protein
MLPQLAKAFQPVAAIASDRRWTSFQGLQDEFRIVGCSTVATHGLLLETLGVADGGVREEGHNGCSDDDSDKGVEEDFLVEDAVDGRGPSHRPCCRCVARQNLTGLPLASLDSGRSPVIDVDCKSFRG